MALDRQHRCVFIDIIELYDPNTVSDGDESIGMINGFHLILEDQIHQTLPT